VFCYTKTEKGFIMTPQDVISSFQTDLSKAFTHFQDEAKKLRTGRAHPSMVEQILVEAYGVPTPLLQLATITTPEPQLIQISPFDPNNLKSIADTIRNDQSLGFNPTDDGRVIRIPIPPLTTERRQQIVKQLNEKKEDCYVSMRSARHDALDIIKKLKNDKDIGEDEAKRAETDIESSMNKSKSEVEEFAKAKESEILTV